MTDRPIDFHPDGWQTPGEYLPVPDPKPRPNMGRTLNRRLFPEGYDLFHAECGQWHAVAPRVETICPTTGDVFAIAEDWQTHDQTPETPGEESSTPTHCETCGLPLDDSDFEIREGVAICGPCDRLARIRPRLDRGESVDTRDIARRFTP